MKLQCKVFSIILAAISISVVSAQAPPYDPAIPRPVFGWDSLQQSIRYPEIAQRAGLDGLFFITVSIDSVGNVTGIADSSIIEILRPSVEHAIRSAKWFPGEKNNRPVAAMVHIPLYFVLDYNANPPLIIHGIYIRPMQAITN